MMGKIRLWHLLCGRVSSYSVPDVLGADAFCPPCNSSYRFEDGDFFSFVDGVVAERFL